MGVLVYDTAYTVRRDRRKKRRSTVTNERNNTLAVAFSKFFSRALFKRV